MLIIGHRGAAGEAPENTIAGFRHAIERGVRHVELDVQLSSDKQLVVIHDDKVNRTTSSGGRVSGFTRAELNKLDARRSGPLWPGRRNTGVPSLQGVLEKCPELRSIQVEVKSGSKRQMRAIAEMLAEQFPSRHSARRIIATSFNGGFLGELAELAPHIPRGLVSSRPDGLMNALALNCTYLICQYSLCNPILVAQAGLFGILVSAWTVNEPDVIRTLQTLKIHSVITDYPSMALPLLSSLAPRSKKLRQ